MRKGLSPTGLLAIVLWACTACIAVVHAAGGGQPSFRQDAAGEALTNDSLKQALTNMGFEPKALSKGFLIVSKQDTWTLSVQVVLSGDSHKIGLNANLGAVEDPSKVSAEDWMNLLVSNGDIDPSSFYFSKDQKKLYLHRSFDNRAITPAILKREIDNFCGNIRQTAQLWKFTK
jgi:hypothetical protein